MRAQADGTTADDTSRLSDALRDVAFLRGLLAALPAFIVVIDHELRISYINRLQPGFTLEGVIGRSALDFVDPRYHEISLRATAEARRTGIPQSYMVEGAGPDGRSTHYQTHIVVVERPGDGPVTAGFSVDVSEHLHTADALRQSEAALRLAVEATGLGLFSFEPRSGHVEWNARMHEITGSSQALTPSEYAATLVHPEDREAVLAVIGQNAVPSHAHRIVRADGEVRWVLPTRTVTREELSGASRVLGGALDVTEQRIAEDRFRHAQKMNAVGVLTAGVAHNFNNLLAMILPVLELAKSGVPAAQLGMIEDAIQAGRRAAELVRQLMTYSGQRQTAERSVVDAVALVRTAVEMCGRTFEPEHRIDCELPDRALPIRCNRSGIEQVLLNLLINARDGVAASGRREPHIDVLVDRLDVAPRDVEVDEAPSYVRIRVRDDGIGMSDAVKKHLFEPFFTTKDVGKGTGLGLATSYAIVREHGGAITCRSAEGEGAELSVILPGAP